MNLSPIQLLREAIKAVPALKYALGVAGLVAVVAIVGAFGVRPEVALFGSVATLVLMVPLLIFAKLTKVAGPRLMVPALVLMWSFLLLVIATASLLFTSTFFKWPIDFASHTNTATTTTTGTNSPQPDVSAAIAEKINTAKTQLDARDYEGAWKTLQSAAGLQPGSDAVLNAQADVAMAWLRDLVVPESKTFTEVVDQLTPCLYSALPKAKGSRQADIQAHIGWAAFLKSRENPSSVDVDGLLRKALAIDPQNMYANAMLGHRLYQESGRMVEGRQHFETALATKRDAEWVKEMWLAALRWSIDGEHGLETAHVANELRKDGQTLSPEQKKNLFIQTYWLGADFDYLTNLVHSLPPAEHLETLEWLVGENGWLEARPQQRFVQAELHEQNGDWSGALEIYRSLTNLRTSDYAKEIKRGIAHCSAQAR